MRHPSFPQVGSRLLVTPSRGISALPPSEIGDASTELTEFKPLDLTFLQSALAPETLKALGPSELKQLRCWQRGSMTDRKGDVVFNTWG